MGGQAHAAGGGALTLPLLVMPAVWASLLVLERRFPGRPLPPIRGWAVAGVACLALSLAVGAATPELLRPWLPDLGGRHLGTAGGAVVAALLGDLVNYWVHRAMHAHPTLWRWTHQLHHAPERMDLLGMAVLHPLDLALTALTTATATTSLGLPLEASAWSAAIAFSAACLQHSNVRTPRWLGLVLPRPEQHAVHHARGVHAHNYAVFPAWDLLFGTLMNPPAGEFPAAYGFWDGGSREVGRMLLGHDASHPPPPPR